jgi:hypothetical protein
MLERHHPKTDDERMDFSSANFISSMFIGLIGFAYFMYGKKAGRIYPLLAGMGMCIYPYFIASAWLMWGICAALMAACWFLREQ